MSSSENPNIEIAANAAENASARSLWGSRGFTLIELIVVVLLLTIMLGFAIPAFRGQPLVGAQESAARELLGAVQKLKIAALRRQSVHRLHLDLDQGRLWISREEKEEEKAVGEKEPAPLSEWALPDGVRILKVRLADGRELGSGTVVIGFYPQGYSDRAVIRLAQWGKPPTDLVVEPFLPFASIGAGDDLNTF